MKKLENFSNCLEVLKNADFEMADNNDIYRIGVIGQFNLIFELAWKALQEILKMHGADGAATGSPREILQLGYKLSFVDDAAVWFFPLSGVFLYPFVPFLFPSISSFLPLSDSFFVFPSIIAFCS